MFLAIMIIFVFCIKYVLTLLTPPPPVSQLSLYVSSVLELASFVGYFYYLGFVFVVLSCLFIAALWPPAGKRLMFYCGSVTFPCDVLGQARYMVVSISDLCLLTYFGRR